MRVLFAAGDALTGKTIPAGVDLLIHSASHVNVMTPTLVSRVAWLTGEIDASRTIADVRLAKVLGELCERGITATGVRGDELPRTAFNDAVAEFTPDHILIALSHLEHTTWQRHNLVDHLIADHGLPVTAFMSPMVAP